MPTRKTFLKQAGFALAGSCIPFSKLFAEGFKPPHVLGIDTQHPKDCSQDLRTPLFPNLANIFNADFLYHKGTYPGIIKDVLYPDEMADCADPGISSVTCDPTDHHYYGLSDPNNNISIY